MGANEGANAGLGLLLMFVNPWQAIDDGNLDFGAVADNVDLSRGSNGVVNSPYFGRTRGTSAASATGKQEGTQSVLRHARDRGRQQRKEDSR